MYFYNIEYSGLDLNGNRYILKSKEAFFWIKSNLKLFNMKFVEANFYFKDNTIFIFGQIMGCIIIKL